jgi:hypothetical protein
MFSNTCCNHPNVRNYGCPSAESSDGSFQNRLVKDQAFCVLHIRRSVNYALHDGAREGLQMREIDQLTQPAVALCLYRVDSPQLSSSRISTQALTGQTSAHSAHAVQRSPRTTRGEGYSLGAGCIAFSGHVRRQAPQPAQRSVTANSFFIPGIPAASPSARRRL